MATQIQDPEVRRLATVASVLSDDYRIANDPWAGSPFAWLKNIPSSRTRGKAFEDIVERWCAAAGLRVAPSRDSDADRIIAGRRTEIKGSTLWKGGTYTFQQIRDQNYHIIVCLGISPFDAHCWVIPKNDVMALRDKGLITPQHGGRRGSDTLWINGVNPSNPPNWLRPYGGTLNEGFARLQSLTGQV